MQTTISSVLPMTVNSSSTLRVAFYNVEPWTTIEEKDGGIVVLDCLMRDIMTYVQLALNVSYSYLPPHHSHGKPANGQWTGVIGSLQRQEADMGMIPFWITYERHQTIDFTPAFVYTFATILSHAPTANKDNFAYMKTLSAEVWVLSFAALLLLSTLYAFLRRMLIFTSSRTFLQSFWDLFGAMWGQAISREPTNQTESTILATWWTFRLVVMTAFCGSLIASYAEVKFVRIDSLDDLAKSHWLQPIAHRYTVFHLTLIGSQMSAAQTVAKRLVRGKGDLPVPVLFRHDTMHGIAEGRLALFYDVIPIMSMVRNHCSRQRQQFYVARNPVFWIPLTIGIRKNLPPAFRKHLDTVVAYYSATMQMERKLRAMRLKAAACLWEGGSSEFAVLTVDDLAGVTYLYVIGVACSVLVFISEKISSRRFRTHL